MANITLTTNYQYITSANFVLPTGYNSTLYIYAKYISQDIANNKTTVAIQSRWVNKYPWYASSPMYGYAGTDSSHYASWNKTYTSGAKAPTQDVSKGQYTTMATYTTTVTHNADGTKSIGVWAKAYQKEWGVNKAISDTVILPRINRAPIWTSQPYASETKEDSFKINIGNLNLTGCTYTYTCAPACTGVADWNAKTISFTNAIPNTKYTINITATYPASGLSATNSISAATYDTPKILSVNSQSLVAGDTQVLNLYNPLNKELTVSVCNMTEGKNEYKLGSIKTSGNGTITLTPPIGTNENELFHTNGLGKSLTEILVGYKVETNDYSNIYDNNKTLKIITTEEKFKPSFNKATAEYWLQYEDSNSTTANMSGDERRIWYGNANYASKIHPLELKNSAIKPIVNYSDLKYYIQICDSNIRPSLPTKTSLNGWELVTPGIAPNAIKVVNSSKSNYYIFLVARDERWYFTEALSLPVPVYFSNNPSASFKIRRVDNFGDKIEIDISPVWDISEIRNLGNAVVSYREKGSSSWIQCSNVFNTSSSFNKFVTLSRNSVETIFDNNKTWEFKIVLTDKIGKSRTYSGSEIPIVGPGTPILFVDAEQDAVGVNRIPDSKGLYVNGSLKVSKDENTTGTTISNIYADRLVFTSDNETVFLRGEGSQGIILASNETSGTTRPSIIKTSFDDALQISIVDGGDSFKRGRIETKYADNKFILDKTGAHITSESETNTDNSIEISQDLTWVDATNKAHQEKLNIFSTDVSTSTVPYDKPHPHKEINIGNQNGSYNDQLGDYTYTTSINMKSEVNMYDNLNFSYGSLIDLGSNSTFIGTLRHNWKINELTPLWHHLDEGSGGLTWPTNAQYRLLNQYISNFEHGLMFVWYPVRASGGGYEAFAGPVGRTFILREEFDRDSVWSNDYNTVEIAAYSIMAYVNLDNIITKQIRYVEVVNDYYDSALKRNFNAGDIYISGDASNNATGTGKSGAKYTNNTVALGAIYGF